MGLAKLFSKPSRGGRTGGLELLFIVGVFLILFFVVAGLVLTELNEKADAYKERAFKKGVEMKATVDKLCEYVRGSQGVEATYLATGLAEKTDPIRIMREDLAREFPSTCFPGEAGNICLEFSEEEGEDICERHWDKTIEISRVDMCPYSTASESDGLVAYIVCNQDCDEPLTGTYDVRAKSLATDLRGNPLPDFCLFFSPRAYATSQVQNP